MAAARLKNQVTSYILENESIPFGSKIVVRVYINISGKENSSKRRLSFKKSRYDRGVATTFALQFTETIPLFDFVDVGHGKERADEKIRGKP
jgi:hypothetical protein